MMDIKTDAESKWLDQIKIKGDHTSLLFQIFNYSFSGQKSQKFCKYSTIVILVQSKNSYKS